MAFDVVRARQDFPALAEGLAHFDGPGGRQVPGVVSEAVAGTRRRRPRPRPSWLS